jgi:REP element-mobilizing transposase RayT
MAQSLCKIYLHIIFHIKTNSPAVNIDHIPRLHQYIGQLVKTTGCHVVCVGGTENHVHTLVLLNSTESVGHLVEEMKRNSSRWIKTLGKHYEKFAWQGGYAAFSVGQSIVEKTKNYIANQAEHHRKKSFKDEYLEFLRLYKIDYDERYVLSD